MSVIIINNSRTSKKARAMNSVMKNTGFGEVIIVRQGEKRLTPEEQAVMTVGKAMELCAQGLAITVA